MHILDPFHTTTATAQDRKLFETFFDTLDKDFRSQIVDQLKHKDVSFDLLIENYLKKDRAVAEEDVDQLDEILEEEGMYIEDASDL